MLLHFNTLLIPVICQWHSSCLAAFSTPKPKPDLNPPLSPWFGCFRERSPYRLRCYYLFLSFRSTFLHHYFHPIGIQCHQCQSPNVTEREPAPRPLSLVHPTLLGTQRDRLFPVHRTALMRTNSLPSHGLRFPALPPVGSRPIEEHHEDDYGLVEYFC